MFPSLVRHTALDVSIAKNQLQLAGITSVYLASKVVECLPLNVDTCVMYTDYSVTKVCLTCQQSFDQDRSGPANRNGIHNDNSLQVGGLHDTGV